MANVLTRPGGRKLMQVITFVVSHATTSFLFMTKILMLLAVECLWMIKLNKPIISVLVYADTIKASLYFQLK